MELFIDSWSSEFRSETYPMDYYYYHLDKIRNANTPKELGEAIIAMLYWKDGKVRRDDTGGVKVAAKGYSLSQIKPNTYNVEKHYEVLVSQAFFKWAKEVTTLSSFDKSKVEEFRSRFKLYHENAIVMPAFILHCLNSLIYPLYDQHVERAKRAFLAQQIHFSSSSLNIDSYIEYQSFFQSFINGREQNLEYSKKVDNALWSFGKWLKEQGRVVGTVKKQPLMNQLNKGEEVFSTRKSFKMSNSGLTEKIRVYIRKILQQAKEAGAEYVDLRSGDIHKQMGLVNRMPPVCNAMESLGIYRYEIIYDTPSGKSSTKVIRYYLID
ncbi:hypothetical protein A8F94_14265 [Bacillus sp. FJAT-27225]|uniref:hypothetical protein n=1 Tax=Bacillus sp. FJAT-27225 TaxID=1743144 RepID=UPI00080C2F25|nr:hypothetical protein [Bacillus sp. FJAT-27225]OCA86006.1 hypothetical protein A8F94_14265 [Bacillus sp. FJAT-27225]